MLKINFEPRLFLLSVYAPAIPREQLSKLPSCRALMPSELVCLKSATELNPLNLYWFNPFLTPFFICSASVVVSDNSILPYYLLLIIWCTFSNSPRIQSLLSAPASCLISSLINPPLFKLGVVSTPSNFAALCCFIFVGSFFSILMHLDTREEVTSKSHHHHKSILQLLLDGFTCRFFTARVKKAVLDQVIKLGA